MFCNASISESDSPSFGQNGLFAYTSLGSPFHRYLTPDTIIASTGPVGPTCIGHTGPIGPRGPTGSIPGPTGPNGFRGPDGLEGPDGVAGATGPQGPLGVQGVEGLVGNTGPEGAQGAQGPVGPSGAQGVDGPAGVDGKQGSVGATGADGVDGVRGVTGPVGATGADGNQGPRGPLSSTGSTGPTGANGEAGNAGVQGGVGPNGPDGPQGGAGAVGAAGPAGAKGSVGAAGPAGATGVDGNTGPKGDVGENGVDAPSSGSTGPNGPAYPLYIDSFTHTGNPKDLANAGNWITYKITGSNPANSGYVTRSGDNLVVRAGCYDVTYFMNIYGNHQVFATTRLYSTTTGQEIPGSAVIRTPFKGDSSCDNLYWVHETRFRFCTSFTQTLRVEIYALRKDALAADRIRTVDGQLPSLQPTYLSSTRTIDTYTVVALDGSIEIIADTYTDNVSRDVFVSDDGQSVLSFIDHKPSGTTGWGTVYNWPPNSSFWLTNNPANDTRLVDYSAGSTEPVGFISPDLGDWQDDIAYPETIFYTDIGAQIVFTDDAVFGPDIRDFFNGLITFVKV